VRGPPPSPTRRAPPACAQALSGVATIGFIGLALNLVVRVGAPVSEAYTVGGVEWLIQGVGGALSTVSAICSVGFFACVALSWLATLVLLLAYFFFGRSSAQAALLDGADGTSTRQ
jgi:ABC-type anion transport system duplicated permease subunit